MVVALIETLFDLRLLARWKPSRRSKPYAGKVRLGSESSLLGSSFIFRHLSMGWASRWLDNPHLGKRRCGLGLASPVPIVPTRQMKPEMPGFHRSKW